MKLKLPIEIDLLTFFKVGKFDFLKLGKSKKWIINNFPGPDDYGIGDNFENAKIWFYGNIELHFDKNELFLIFWHNINELDGGKSIKLDKWILSDPSTLTLKFVIEQLINEKIDFTKKTLKISENVVRLCLTTSRVELSFTGEDDNGDIITNPNLYKLHSISLIKDEYKINK